MTAVQLLTLRLDGHELGTTTEPHLLRNAAAHARLLLGDRHRDALTALRATATKDFTTTTGLLASTEAVRALAALVMRLIRTLHGSSPAFAERDRYALGPGVSRTGRRSRAVGCRSPRRARCRGCSELPRRRKTRARTAPDFSTKIASFGSRNSARFVLRSEIAICYQGQTFSCGQLVTSGRGSAPEEGVDNFWNGCLLPVVSLLVTA